jgi:ABC-type lipoprotein release transport system permease subunit
VETQDQVFDRGTAFMLLADLQYLTAFEGRVHEIAVRIEDLDQAPAMARELATSPSTLPCEPRGWSRPGQCAPSSERERRIRLPIAAGTK